MRIVCEGEEGIGRHVQSWSRSWGNCAFSDAYRDRRVRCQSVQMLIDNHVREFRPQMRGFRKESVLI